MSTHYHFDAGDAAEQQIIDIQTQIKTVEIRSNSPWNEF
jgi:hypothetical protein